VTGKRGLLVHQGDACTKCIGRGTVVYPLTVEPHLSRVGTHGSSQNLQQRRLPGSVAAQQGMHIPGAR
jgi:hypothetical protein